MLACNIQAFKHAPERREALRVEGRVVHVVDEQLRRSSVRPSSRVSDGASQVALHHWIVLDGDVPAFVRLRRGGDAKLQHKIRDHAKEGGLVVETVLQQGIETVDPQRSPRPRHFEEDAPTVGLDGRLDLDLEHFRGLRVLALSRGHGRPDGQRDNTEEAQHGHRARRPIDATESLDSSRPVNSRCWPPYPTQRAPAMRDEARQAAALANNTQVLVPR